MIYPRAVQYGTSMKIINVVILDDFGTHPFTYFSHGLLLAAKNL